MDTAAVRPRSLASHDIKGGVRFTIDITGCSAM